MHPEITVDVDGRKVRLSMPLGGLEQVAKVNPAIAEVAIGLAASSWRLDELIAVLQAGLDHGDKSMTAQELIAALKLHGSVKAAIDLMTAAFGAPGNADAAADTKSEENSL